MSGDNSKEIPKFKADIKILLETSQIVNDYTIFLRMEEGSNKAESLGEFLQEENRLFLPVVNNNSKTFELMNAHNVIYIKDTQKTSAEAGKTVTLIFVNKTKLKVKISSNSLVDRLSDFINTKNFFLEFITEDGFNIYINKNKISTVLEKVSY